MKKRFFDYLPTVNLEALTRWRRPRHPRQLLLKKRFKEISNFLTKTPLGIGSTTLAELPYHLVIGLSDAGKTALLANADVRYLTSHNTPAINMPHECEWWVSKKAIYLDIPGSYWLPENHSLWRQLLSFLKKSCDEKSLRSIVLVLTLDDILNINKKKLQLIKNKISALQKKFSAVLPINLVINKCDKLPGFEAFFSNLSQEERYQTLSLDFDVPFTMSQFNQQFSLLFDQLNARALQRLASEQTIKRQLTLKDFASEMGRLQKPLHHVITLLTMPTQKKLSTINIHACYFCAAAGENLSSLSRSETDAIKLFHFYSKSYFTHDLLETVLPEHPLLNKPYRSPWLIKTIVTIGASLVTIMLITWVISLIHQANTIKKAAQTLEVYQRYTQSHPEAPLGEVLPFFYDMSDAYQTSQKGSVHFLQSNATLEKIDSGFHQAVIQSFIPKLKALLESRINNSLAHKDYLQLYALLKTYLMLNNPQYFSSDYLTFEIAKMLNITDTSALHELLVTAINPANGEIPLEANLIKQAQNQLKQLEPPKLAFIILQNSAGTALLNPAVPFKTDHVLQWMNIPEEYNSIPTLYTSESLQRTLSEDIPAIVTISTQTNWVLGEPYANSADQNDLAAQINQFYIAEYSNQWSVLLSRVALTVPHTLKEAQKLLEEITSSNSSLLILLKAVDTNTNFKAINQLNIPLASLNSLLDTKYRPSPLLQDVLTQVSQLNTQLLNIINSANPAQAAFEFSRDKMNQQLNEKVVALINTSSLQEPAKSWFDQLSMITWELLVKESIGYLKPLE